MRERESYRHWPSVLVWSVRAGSRLGLGTADGLTCWVTLDPYMGTTSWYEYDVPPDSTPPALLRAFEAVTERLPALR